LIIEETQIGKRKYGLATSRRKYKAWLPVFMDFWFVVRC
jgi:hypothetical protein